MIYDNLINDKNAILEKYDVPRRYINIEITESIGDIKREIVSSN